MDFIYRRLHVLILLILTVEATDSSNNETSHEVRQSRVTGRIVKLYSGTRPEPIICASEGFQADPHNCAVFYRCMKSGHGKFTVFKFQCGPGTVYDPETEVCNHPRSTKRSECGGISLPSEYDSEKNNEIEFQPELPSPITNKPFVAPTFTESSTVNLASSAITAIPWVASSPPLTSTTKRQTLPSIISTTTHKKESPISPFSTSGLIVDSSTMTSMTTSTSLSSASRGIICTSDGFMGDIEDCRKFYRCVANNRGTYTRYDFSCSESTIWDDDTQSCNHVWAVKRSRCGRSNQHSGTDKSPNTVYPADNGALPLKENSQDKTIQQQLQVSYGSKVTQSQTQISSGSVKQNQTQIHFGDRLNENKNSIAEQNQTQISNGSAISQTQTQIDYGDKGVQTQLQIDHSQQSSQTQVQIQESTTRGTSASKDSFTTAAGTQSTNKCNRSGFMGDTKDCKKFYRCIDNGRGGYTKFEFSCGEGTVWDQSIEACNHAWAVKECGGKDSTSSTTTASTAQITSTENDHTTISTGNSVSTPTSVVTEDYGDNGYGHQTVQPITSLSTTLSSSTITSLSTTLSSTTITSPSKGECQTSGFIGDANDCKVFYRCVENGRGSFTKYEFKCGEGTVWDPDLEACNHAWAVKKCGGNASPDINKVETTTYKQTTPSTQSSTILYSSTESSATQNDDYDTGYGSGNNGFTSSTTTSTAAPHNIDHSTGNVCRTSGFMGDQNDCKKFYRCVDNGNGGFIRYEFTCGEGTVWDPKIEACNHVWAVEKCSESGSVINYETTTKTKPTTSQETISSSTTEGHQEITSSSTVRASTSSNTSTIAESESSSKNICTRSGFMGDKKDCKKFYRCVDNGNGSYTKYEFSCGEGTVWDQRIDACNHAWAVEKCGDLSGTSNNYQETTPEYHPTLSDEVDNGYPSSDGTVSYITTQKTTSTTEDSKESSGPCTSSGFVGDKRDCKKFYRCVDDGKGGFIRYEFSCGEGTLWDQSIEACNHAWAVKRNCAESGSEAIPTSGPQTTHVSSTMESGNHGYPQSTEKTSTSTIGTYPDSSTKEKCYKEGFIGDSKDCKKFYRCVDNGQGGFIQYEFICGEGTYWNQEIFACDHVTSGNTCKDKENSVISEMPPVNDEMYTEATVPQSSTENIIHFTQSPSVSSGVCTSEGFYGDQNDCKKFYRCVDNGKGSYTKYDFICGDGTIWDSEIQACNHESSNNKCLSYSTPSTTQSTQSEYNGSISSTTPIQISTEKTETSSLSSDNQCTSEGFFADPKNCKKFIRCVSNSKGGYIKYEFTCGEGTIWVQDILACDHDNDNSICNSQMSGQASSTEASQHTTQKYEPGSSTSEHSADKQEDEYDPGNSQTTESTTVKSSSESSQGTTSANKETCENEGYYGDSRDCKKFYRCVDNGKGGFTKYDFTCGEGTIWDQDVTTCNHPQDVVNPTCNQNQDGSTISTMSTTTTSMSTTSSSSPSTSTETSTTTTTESTQSSSNCSQEQTSKKPGNQNFICDKAGFYANPNDCKKFYRCVDWDGDGKRFSIYHFDCGEGTIWDPAVETCNHKESVYPPRDCSGSESQSQTTTDSTTTTHKSTTTEKSTTQLSTEQSTQSTTEKTSTQQPTTSEQSTTQQSTSSEHTTTQQSTTSEHTTAQTSTSSEQTTAQQSTTTEQTTTLQSNESTTNEQSTTQQSTTEQSTTEQSTTEQSTTEQSTTGQSTTEQSTTESSSELSTTEQSTTEQPATEQPTNGQSTTEQSTTESSTEQSTAGQSTTEQSTTGQSTTEQSTTESSTEQSTTEKSTTEQSTTEPSTTEQSTTGQPVTEQSTTGQSTTEQSTTEQSTTEQSMSTTESSTTDESSTQQHTTTEKSEQSTTEESVSTQGTTTEESSTTTEQTNEIPSENKCPDTDADQNLFVCPTSFRRHPKYCNLFYQCDEDNDTHDTKIAVFTCPNNTIYDESQTRCVEENKADKKCDGQIAQKRRFKRLNNEYKEPIVVTKDSQACTSAGYFSFEKDSECSPAFLKCKTDKNKKIRGLVYQCPSGYVFWSISRRCEPINRVRDCKRSQNNWTGRWEIPIERRNVAPMQS